jgi:hypothetical protein
MRNPSNRKTFAKEHVNISKYMVLHGKMKKAHRGNEKIFICDVIVILGNTAYRAAHLYCLQHTLYFQKSILYGLLINAQNSDFV